jgi:hypothetical protein
MLLAEFLADPENEHKTQGNPKVRSNALHKTGQSFNCYLTASQAIEHARNLLQKAQLILDHDLEDAVVHVWNTSGEKLYVGMTHARKGTRRKKSQ